MRCWLASLGLGSGPCVGPWDFAHIGYSEHYLLKSPTGPHLSEEEANDPRLLYRCCRAHHGQLDIGSITLTRNNIPESVEEFGREHRNQAGKPLTVYLDKKFGPLDSSDRL